MPRQILLFLVATTLTASAAPPSCPAGLPLGTVNLSVRRSDAAPPIPLNAANRIEEGDEIVYSPVLRPKEKRSGKVALVLIASQPQENPFEILEPHDADEPARWKAPFNVALAMYVYGPSGLSTRKLKGFLNKDQELVSQLADYAEKTAQTEIVLQALSTFQTSGGADNVGAALQGFANQYGINAKIDRNAPLNEQTLAALRTLNPALSAYDPIAPSPAQRMSQTAGLAATVAGMFLGSTVGLAAGSTAMALNLKTILFPDADFRSAYGQAAPRAGVALCTSRQPHASRKRIAYLWALRIPDADPPAVSLKQPTFAPAGLRSVVPATAPDGQWRLASRVREWSLLDEQGASIPVKVVPALDKQQFDIDLTGVPPGTFKLKGLWDWDWFDAGQIFVAPLATFDNVHLTPESQNGLQQHTGKRLITLMGADFQFLDKAAIVRKEDRYATPAPVPFRLPKGPRQGLQETVEMQVDTTGLSAATYSLLLSQSDGKQQAIDVKVLPEPPKISSLPIVLHEGDGERQVRLEGEGLDRILELSANGVEFKLESAVEGAKSRTASVHPAASLEAGRSLELSMSVRDYAAPIVLSEAIRIAEPRPVIRKIEPSLPADLPIALRPGELPAGVQLGAMLHVSGAGDRPTLRLRCKDNAGAARRVTAGAASNGLKLSPMQEGMYFLSFDPGQWSSGCVLAAALEAADAGESEAIEVGRVVRMPRIDEFRLTEERAGDGNWVGIIVGRDLELIGKTGWDAQSGLDVLGLPQPVAGDGNRQELRVRVAWPSPTPRAPLFIWFRGETEGRATTVRP